MKFLFIGGPRDGERVEIESECGLGPDRHGEYIHSFMGLAPFYRHESLLEPEAIAQLIERYPEPEKRPIQGGTETEYTGDLDAVGGLFGSVPDAIAYIERRLQEERDKGTPEVALTQMQQDLNRMREARSRKKRDLVAAVRKAQANGEFNPPIKPGNLFTASCGCVFKTDPLRPMPTHSSMTAMCYTAETNSRGGFFGQGRIFNEHMCKIGAEWMNAVGCQQAASLGVDVPSSDGVEKNRAWNTTSNQQSLKTAVASVLPEDTSEKKHLAAVVRSQRGWRVHIDIHHTNNPSAPRDKVRRIHGEEHSTSTASFIVETVSPDPRWDFHELRNAVNMALDRQQWVGSGWVGLLDSSPPEPVCTIRGDGSLAHVDVPSSEGVDEPADDDFDMEQFAKDVGSPVIEIEPSVVELPPNAEATGLVKWFQGEISYIGFDEASGKDFTTESHIAGATIIHSSEPVCPDCKNTRVYRGLNTVEPCKTCGGEK